MKTAHFVILTSALLFGFMGLGHYLSPKEMKVQCLDQQTKRVMYDGNVVFISTNGGFAEIVTINGAQIHLSNVNCKEQ